MAESGAILAEIQVGDVRIVTRYGCTRRDQFELHVPGPIPDHVRAKLVQRGDTKDLGQLIVIEVPGVHQITVAVERGRVVVMPRLTRDRAFQRDDMMVIAQILADRDRRESPGG